MLSHLETHRGWYTCLHGRIICRSPLLYSIWQTTHLKEEMLVTRTKQDSSACVAVMHVYILLVSRKMLIVSVGGYDVCKWCHLTREEKNVVISDMGINMGSHSPRTLGSYQCYPYKHKIEQKSSLLSQNINPTSVCHSLSSTHDNLIIACVVCVLYLFEAIMYNSVNNTTDELISL